MKTFATIKFVDKESSDNAIIIVKGDETNVALTISLESNGDVQAIMSKEDARKVLANLKQAVE